MVWTKHQPHNEAQTISKALYTPVNKYTLSQKGKVGGLWKLTQHAAAKARLRTHDCEAAALCT